MYKGKKFLGIIPARGGSKGLPGKNIKPLQGKPLIGWTIEACQNSKYLDYFILSSDDDEIIQVAQSMGCDVPFKRPTELSQDSTSGIEPVLHAIEKVPGYDFIVLLQPTSPFRRAEDIDCSIELCLDSAASSCISVTPAKPSSWYLKLSEQGVIKRADEVLDTQRQGADENFIFNGAIYVVSVDSINVSRQFVHKDSVGYVMPQEASIDIDTAFDLQLAEALLVSKKGL